MNNSYRFLGVDFSSHSLKLFVEKLLGSKFQPSSIHLAAASTIVASVENPNLCLVLNSGLVIADSSPIRFLIGRKSPNFKGFRGADLLREVLLSDTNLRHFFIVSNDEVLSKFASKVHEINPLVRLEGLFTPPMIPIDFDPEPWVKELNLKNADLVWIGLGSPKQDFIASKLAAILEVNVIAVGAAIDFIAGDLRECPSWLQNSGFEWVFRLLVEPRRLWRRYFIGNLKFLKYVIRQELSETLSRKSAG